MVQLVVTAKEVRVDDRVWNRYFYARDKWLRVTQVRQSGDYIVISAVMGFQTWKHPLEAVAVQRAAVRVVARTATRLMSAWPG